MVKPWPVESRTSVASLKIFDVYRDSCRSPRDGQLHDFSVIECGDWVNIIPICPDGAVVFIRQYRVGTRQITLEVPGGMVDPGETPLEAAVRELREETGYRAARVLPLGSIEPNPAIQNNRCHSFLAEGCVRAHELALDDGEDIEVLTLPEAEVPGLIASGAISHVLVAHAFHRLDLFRRGF
jgi:8-oxo-dGTP pyrophosphatase MutT (NUDIX family)